jgi:RNA polymerase sigma-70 factor (ECF subfamily)
MVTPADEWSARSQALAEALARTALGDRAAFRRLYDGARAHLFGVILRIQPDRSRAEDVLQEVFVKVWRSASSFDAARAQPLTWLSAIARNGAIDSLRRGQTQPQTVSLTRDDDEAEDTAVEASDDVDPLALLQRAGQARAVAHCVGELTARQQQCLALAFYQGLSHAEVAEHLGQPLGSVKSWVRRALMALKDCLGRTGQSGQA